MGIFTTLHQLQGGVKCAYTQMEGYKVAWIYLIIAALFECGWAIGLKYTDGFTKIWPSVFTIVAMIVSFQFLALAMKTIPVGTAYAIWTGIGTVGVAVLGMVLFGESKDIARILCIALIIAGVIGLKIFSGQHTS